MNQLSKVDIASQRKQQWTGRLVTVGIQPMILQSKNRLISLGEILFGLRHGSSVHKRFDMTVKLQESLFLRV